MTYPVEIQARLDAASHGSDWVKHQIRDGAVISWVVEGVARWRGYFNDIDLGADEASADLIANAPTDLAYLLIQLASAEARITKAVSAFKSRPVLDGNTALQMRAALTEGDTDV